MVSFSVYPKTQVIDRVSSGSTVITVDSTVGFDCPGELYLTYDDEYYWNSFIHIKIFESIF